MPWLQSFFCGVLCAALGAFATGYIANECVTWYRVSTREGSAGYMVVFFGLVGLVLGFVIGIVVSRLAGGSFLNHLGTAVILILGLEFIGYVIARAGGDVAPTISGDTLNVLFELRCPKAWAPNNAVKSGRNGLRLSAVNSADVQKDTYLGDLDWTKARSENGYTVIPGKVFLYSSSAKRVVTFNLGNAEIDGFLVPLAPSPGKEYFHWSQWLPSVDDDNPVARGFRYRFRIQLSAQTASEQQQAREARIQSDHQALESLKTDAPLSAYLRFFSGNEDEEIPSKVGEIFRARAEELSPLLHDADPNTASLALKSIKSLNTLPESFDGHLRQAAAGIAEAIGQYRKNDDPKDPDTLLAARIYKRYSAWSTAWYRMIDQKPRPAPVELNDIRQAASAMENVAEMRNVTNSARDLLRR